MNTHTHRVKTEEDYPWTQCVWPQREHTERPHGGITVVQTCRCGATRYQERNGGMRVASNWTEPG